MKFNNELLVLARESRGLTQKQLSESIGIVQATVSKIEKGLKTPDNELLEKFANALGYPTTFFGQDAFFRVKGYFRMKLSLPEKLSKSYIATMSIVDRHFTILQDAVELPEINLPMWEIDLDGSPEMAANYSRQYWKLPSGRVSNLTEILEDNGIIVIHIHLGEMDGFSTFSDSGRPLIFINKRSTSDRMRFSLAHELGHIILHWGKKNMGLDPREDVRDYENEANQFASEFLMPTQDIQPYLSKLTPQRLGELKLYWKTSMYSLARKAKLLGTISQDQYYYLMKLFSSNGYRRNGEPEIFEKEKASIFDDILSLYMNELGYTIEELSELLYISKENLEVLYFNRVFLKMHK